jgi:hypothetical protein
MNRSSRFGAVLGLGWVLGVALAASGQAVPPPVPDLPVADLTRLSEQMAVQARNLAEDIQSEIGQTGQGRQLSQDATELAQAADEFREAVRRNSDRFRLRQVLSGIDTSWRHLQAQLAQPGSTSPAVARAADRVGRLDAQLVQLFGLNPIPGDYYRTDRAPTGMAVTHRLARAVADRAEALASVVRADMVGPGTARVVQDTVNLAQATDAYHDGIDLNAGPDLARNGYAGVVTLTQQVDKDFAAAPPTPRVRDALRTFKAAEVLLRQNLNLPVPNADLDGTAIPATGPSPVVALAGQLVDQVTAFLQVFGPTAGVVPEGAWFLADAQRLQAAAADFRQDAAGGLDPARLAYEFRDVDALWQRLARRTNRIARGRTGPNIQQVGLMGQTVAEIHRLLGMPGYAPLVAPLPPPG